MKYRITIRDSDDYPYQVEYKTSWFSFWNLITVSESVESAEKRIKAHFDARKKIKLKLKVGKVVKEITEADFLVEKLQGKY